MAFNRLLDADDRRPQSAHQMRHLPAGLLSRAFAWGFRGVLVAGVSVRRASAESAVFSAGAGGAWRSSSSIRSPSASRRFRTWCWDLRWGSRRPRRGSPCADSLDPRILWLTAAVTFWTAGFDIIYSCQDYEFDCARDCSACRAVRHCAARCGSRAGLHVLMIACLLALVTALHLGALALAGIAAIVALLIYEHSLVKAERSLARQRGLLHHERLRQRVILRILGGRYFPARNGAV